MLPIQEELILCISQLHLHTPVLRQENIVSLLDIHRNSLAGLVLNPGTHSSHSALVSRLLVSREVDTPSSLKWDGVRWVGDGLGESAAKSAENSEQQKTTHKTPQHR